MGKDLNKVQLTGRLGADPEGRYTADGAFVATFRVAVGRQWKDRHGTQHEETEWFRIVAWDKLGEICNQYLNKGARIYVEGRLKTRRWTDRDGGERFTTEVIAQDMIMLSSRTRGVEEPEGDMFEESPAEEPTQAPATTPEPDQAPRHLASPRTSAPSVGRNRPQPIEGDDEIPF